MIARPLRLAWIVAAAGCAAPLVVARPRAAPTQSAPATGCETCHAAIAAEWRSSFHRTAFVDETFQASLAMEEPRDHAFCNHCHAPAATRAGGSASGVDCTACHGATPHEPRRAGAGASSCATCHEFTFDDGRPELAQKTLSEHAASDFASVPCAQCHMPAEGGHKDHRFASGHAPERMARALQIEVTPAPAAANAVRVTIRTSVGHAFPTGDMFRRARLVVLAEGARGEIVADAERTFSREWGGPGARTERSDTRIRGSWAETIELDAPSAPVARVRWTLLYERVLAVRGAHASVASSDIVAEGELAWPR